MSNEITSHLKYANLQMAAEAIKLNEVVAGTITLKAAVEFGNNRSSKFTGTQAQEFANTWEVVDHKPDTSTGFSGTLFKNKQTGELVMSFRSTEFADDAARDNQATNSMEIKEEGWAFGQIDDMESWVSSLKASGKIDPGVPLAGRSLRDYFAKHHHRTGYRSLKL